MSALAVAATGVVAGAVTWSLARVARPMLVELARGSGDRRSLAGAPVPVVVVLVVAGAFVVAGLDHAELGGEWAAAAGAAVGFGVLGLVFDLGWPERGADRRARQLLAGGAAAFAAIVVAALIGPTTPGRLVIDAATVAALAHTGLALGRTGTPVGRTSVVATLVALPFGVAGPLLAASGALIGAELATRDGSARVGAVGCAPLGAVAGATAVGMASEGSTAVAALVAVAAAVAASMLEVRRIRVSRAPSR